MRQRSAGWKLSCGGMRRLLKRIKKIFKVLLTLKCCNYRKQKQHNVSKHEENNRNPIVQEEVYEVSGDCLPDNNHKFAT